MQIKALKSTCKTGMMGQRASINLFQVNTAITNRPFNRCIRMALAVEFTCSITKEKKLMQLEQFVNAVIGNLIQKYLRERIYRQNIVIAACYF